eukprot:scaffold4063_cov40-Attheya_sp.AAC.1
MACDLLKNALCCGEWGIGKTKKDRDSATLELVDDEAYLEQSDLPRPSIYEEATEMLAGAMVIYSFADVRSLARKGEIQTTLTELEPPMAVDQMMRIIATTHAFVSNNNNHNGRRDSSQLKLLQFVDDHSESECVHATVINPKRKRITIIFRGSVTQQDFITDAKCHQTKIANPAKRFYPEDDSCTTDTINIHTGETRLHIMLEDLKLLVKQYPGYRVFVTGHSLGGALSTLFGFYAAANDDIQKTHPVTVALERLGRLQHLRLANYEDTVTLLPFFAPKLTLISPIMAASMGGGNLYKHCGMRLRFKRNDNDIKHTIVYAKDHADEDAYSNEIEDAVESGKTLWNALTYMVTQDYQKVLEFHSCEEYEERIESVKYELEKITLDDLYQDKKIVGNILDPDYKPVMMLGFKDRASRFSNSLTKSDTREVVV